MAELGRWWPVAVAVFASAVIVWLLLVAVLWRVGSGLPRLRDAARLLPDVLRLVRRLASDPTVPLAARAGLWLLLAYLVLPIDLVPDVIPVVGYADDVVLTVVVLRAVISAAGPDALARHWPGTPDGLAVVRAAVGLPSEPATPARDSASEVQ